MALKKIIWACLAILVIGFPFLVTDLYFEWITFLPHSAEYPIKLGAIFMLVSAFVTLLLAWTAVRTIEESNAREKRERTEELAKEERNREEHFLNELIEWSVNVLKLCSRLAMGMNVQSDRSKALDEFLTLKYIVKNLKILAENKKFDNVLLEPLKKATECFDGLTMDGLQSQHDKRTGLEKNCEEIGNEALRLLKI